MTAIKVNFNYELEKFSDEEGKVPSRAEDAGFERGGTMVTKDCESFVFIIKNEVTDKRLERLKEILRGEPYHWRGQIDYKDVEIINEDNYDLYNSVAEAKKDK